MVKLNGPMFSMDAAGKLGGAIVFSKWKGRHYARALVTPSNPKSGPQVGVRQMLAFLSQDWSNIGTTAQNTWNDRADAKVISNFNAYMGINLARWRNFLAPGQSDPVGESDTVGTLLNEAATAGVRQITIDIDVSVIEDNWGIMVFRDLTTGFTTAFTNLVHVIPAITATSYAWIDTPLAADEYFYNFRAFSLDGTIGTEHGEVDATVV